MQLVPTPPSETPRARIAPLSVLPVFFDLTGKRVVVAGGCDCAAWKAELLAAAGAKVDVYAPTGSLSPEMAEIAGRGPAISLHDRSWDPDCLAGAVIAVADVETDAEAGAFETAARAAGVACNVVDRPAYSHFTFGSVVNRSPVVVGISTSGASPVLSQAIRRRIETLLPHALADWAALARRLRAKVANRFATPGGRRVFWERFADRAFGPAPEAKETDAVLHELTLAAGGGAKGHVTFVGAGPGEAELLTLKAVRALQAADVILFDDLVSDEVLELARREAKRILVGKRAGRPSCKQEDINRTMIALATAGRRVVRLKSGDAMIFGRAGEEIAELEAAGIEFDVVPGITAGLAMAAALGVSLTHRDHARSVRFVAGHAKEGGLPADLDWRAIADPMTTTIFYMGGRTAKEIAARLMENGLAPRTPIAVAAALGRPNQRKVITNLAGLPAAMMEFDPAAPILIGVGAVFGLARSHADVTSVEREKAAL
jgi:uroporphyrin-III C-methyltransferase / precorrin-2 dehydrogenase / sirohydrochlorin ferrochelatase